MIKCIYCKNIKNTIKAGFRKTKQGKIQKYYCKKCKKYFTNTIQKHNQYPLKVILYALSSYNKGYSVKKIKTLTGRKYKISPSTRTIYSWIKNYERKLPMLNLRKKYNYTFKDLISTHKLEHIQIYPFSYHNLKLNIYSKKLPQLKRYINWIERALPTNMFLDGPRASTLKIHNNLKLIQKKNNVSKLVKFALINCNKPSNAHNVVEEFFLINDASTVCTELPVFIKPEEINDVDTNIPITGHIDIIQIKYDKIFVLDYKPNLNNPKQYVSQMYLYKKAVHLRTAVSEEKIIPALFNEYSYYELI